MGVTQIWLCGWPVGLLIFWIGVNHEWKHPGWYKLTAIRGASRTGSGLVAMTVLAFTFWWALTPGVLLGMLFDYEPEEEESK